MRFGICAGMDSAKLLHEAGYDYIELSAARDLMPEESEAEWNEKRRIIDALPLKPEVFNSFVRSGKIVGPEADAVRLRNYVQSALTRAAQVGGKTIVFGSGGARAIPDGFERDKAERQLREFLMFCADASEQTGVVVAIEPLYRQEVNLINRVSEGAHWARSIGRPGVQNLADTFHMEAENEPLSAIVESKDVLAHVHTADTHRRAPGTGQYDHAAFFQALRAAEYDARVSIECSWDNLPEQAASALTHLREADRH